jgi:hypothetical protein
MKKITFSFHKHSDSRRHSGFWRKIGHDPFVDWALIASVSFVLAIVCVAVGAYVYADSETRLSSAPTSQTSAGSDITRFDSQELYRIVTAFDVRAAERLQFEKGYAGPLDPSLP